MARTLNNEVDVLNIASLDNDIKDSFTRAMITEDVNTTSAAARRYLEGEYFIHTDRYLYKALEDIEAGTTITPDVNAEVVTVSEELVRLFAQSPEGIFEILSNVENTSVASKNYVKGSQFIWTDKKLYEATADIASGSTFVVGTNIKLAGNLTSQIQTLTNNDDAMLNELGAKNLLPNTLTSQTSRGITFTVNSDGSVTINGVLDGTVTYVTVGEISVKKGQKYTLNGADVNDDAHVFLRFVVRDSSGTPLAIDGSDTIDIYNGEKTITIPSGGVNLRCSIIVDTQGTSVNDVTFYPMVRPASIQDDTYVPYAKTNYVLTRNIQHNINGMAVGYYAKRTYQASEMSNVSQGSITIANANGIGTVILSNVVCTPNVALLDVSSYFGTGKYYYDENVSGIIIDNSRLICRSGNMGYRILTFVM